MDAARVLMLRPGISRGRNERVVVSLGVEVRWSWCGNGELWHCVEVDMVMEF